MTDNFKILLDKLNVFIKKYYINKLLKGLIISLSIYVAWYLIVVVAEYFGRFSSSFRTVLFIVTLASFAFILIKMIIITIFNFIFQKLPTNYKTH
jgi:ABC-type multidrug transport system fused ATPase/permease subunit